MKRLYLDTNVFLHYRYGEIDWCAFAGAEEVSLVVVAEVFREVEKHKDQSRNRLQARARVVSSWIAKVWASQDRIVRPGVRLDVTLKDLTNQQVEAFGLSPDVADDRILAAILTEREAGGFDPLLVTADNLRRLKAEASGLRAISPPDDTRLPEEPDARDEEVRKLRRQLDERPKLALGFPDRPSHLSARLLVFEEFSEEHLDEMIEEKRSSLASPLSAAMRATMYTPPSDREIQRYLDELRQWLRDNHEHIIRGRLTVSVDIELENEGRGTATDIEVSFSVPAPIALVQLSPAEVPPPPAEPEWRSKFDPLGNVRLLKQQMDRAIGGGVSFADIMAAEQRDGTLDTDSSHPQTASFHLRALKHTTAHRVSLPVWFENAEDALATKGFGITYRVHAAAGHRAGRAGREARGAADRAVGIPHQAVERSERHIVQGAHGLVFECVARQVAVVARAGAHAIEVAYGAVVDAHDLSVFARVLEANPVTGIEPWRLRRGRWLSAPGRGRQDYGRPLLRRFAAPEPTSGARPVQLEPVEELGRAGLAQRGHDDANRPAHRGFMHA